MIARQPNGRRHNPIYGLESSRLDLLDDVVMFVTVDDLVQLKQDPAMDIQTNENMETFRPVKENVSQDLALQINAPISQEG